MLTPHVDEYGPFLLDNRDQGSGMQVGATFADVNTGLVVKFVSEDGRQAKDPACINYEEVCGNGICAGDETSVLCPQDCKAQCGDGVCYAASENFLNCPQDCILKCSDGICGGYLNAANCPSACPALCGDGSCSHDETYLSCSRDCSSFCGDGLCNARGQEGCTTCPADCGECEYAGYETAPDAPAPRNCGNGICQRRQGEDCSTCSSDCGVCPSPPPPKKRTKAGRRRNLLTALNPTVPLSTESRISNSAETTQGAKSLSTEPRLAGNTDAAESLDAETSPKWLVHSVTSNDIVIPRTHLPEPMSRKLTGIAASRGLQSGGPAICGNKKCEGGENGENCAFDCCPTPKCGDGICQAYAGEECENCPVDCAGDLDGEAGAPFCCGAYVGCGHDERCTGQLLWSGSLHKCHMHCGAN
eukprot:gene18689-25209_t